MKEARNKIHKNDDAWTVRQALTKGTTFLLNYCMAQTLLSTVYCIKLWTSKAVNLTN